MATPTLQARGQDDAGAGQSGEAPSQWPALPERVWYEVLQRMGARELGVARLVCRPWHRCITATVDVLCIDPSHLHWLPAFPSLTVLKLALRVPWEGACDAACRQAGWPSFSRPARRKDWALTSLATRGWGRVDEGLCESWREGLAQLPVLAPQLRELHLARCLGTSEALSAQAAAQLTCLTRLTWQQGMVSQQGSEPPPSWQPQWLPPWLPGLAPTLRSLDIQLSGFGERYSYAKLPDAPPELLALSRLQSLSLVGCMLRSVWPELLVQLGPQLTALNLSNNKLRSLPRLRKLTRLQDLDVSSNPALKGLPRSATALSALTALNLAHCSCLLPAGPRCRDALPRLAALTALRRLTLHPPNCLKHPDQAPGWSCEGACALGSAPEEQLPTSLAALTGLTYLSVGWAVAPVAWADAGWVRHPDHGYGTFAGCTFAAFPARLVAAMPNLAELHLPSCQGPAALQLPPRGHSGAMLRLEVLALCPVQHQCLGPLLELGGLKRVLIDGAPGWSPRQLQAGDAYTVGELRRRGVHVELVDRGY